ncbi:MAG: outer membrane exchange protein TraA family protein [Polyangiaceae bacterium]
MLTQRLASAIIAVTAAVTSVASIARAEPVVIPTSIANQLQGQGTGLCIAQAISANPAVEFNLNTSTYNGGLNTFMEQHQADRVESVVRTLLDLSNNNSSGLQASFGDFTNAVASCKLGGCDFLVNDTSTGFGARARGFLNVTPEMVGQAIHFGLYADDSVSLTFFGPSGAIYPIIIRPPQLGNPTWRVTNTVTFQQPGLYPLEILFAEISEHAALEMSWLIDPNFVDFERPANQAPVVKLKGAGFELFGPESFSQTISGQPSFPDIDQCQHCDRQFVNLPGNNGCPTSYYCNEAALCAPCDSAVVCGPSCSPCGGKTPFCINLKGTFTCVQCEVDEQCQPGYKCDKELHICHECEQDADCTKGNVCEDNVCVPCTTQGECAGNSCNCCPKTADGVQTTCGALPGATTPTCVECTADADCSEGKKCDLVVGRCMDALYENEAPDCCGDDCLKCPEEAPFCLPTHIGTACAECRHDMDCGDGKYCRSGLCTTCNDDRRCGERCDSCGGDTPFCVPAQVVELAECVRCLSSLDCGEGGTCDPFSHLCTNPCLQSCALETPYCFGDTCVQCYADTQCPCGGTCNLETHTCTTSCVDNGDCQANEHCQFAENGQTRECELGQMPDDVGCGSTLGSLCQKSSIGLPGEDPIPLTGALIVSGLLLASRRRRRPPEPEPKGPAAPRGDA